MKKKIFPFNRRNFIKKSSMMALGSGGLLLGSSACTLANHVTEDSDIHIIGPKSGFTPQMGTMVSMLNWMRMVILFPVQGMTIDDLDYLHDEDANSVGALLLHLAATERYYQVNTFDESAVEDISGVSDEMWSAASELGDRAREAIKGNELDFYLKVLSDVREFSLSEFAKRDDDWLMAVDEDWPWGPTNNYCKWFHVCEHESNHNGQVKWLKSRLPSSRN